MDSLEAAEYFVECRISLKKRHRLRHCGVKAVVRTEWLCGSRGSGPYKGGDNQPVPHSLSTGGSWQVGTCYQYRRDYNPSLLFARLSTKHLASTCDILAPLMIFRRLRCTVLRTAVGALNGASSANYCYHSPLPPGREPVVRYGIQGYQSGAGCPLEWSACSR